MANEFKWLNISSMQQKIPGYQSYNESNTIHEIENIDTNARNKACNMSDSPPAKKNNDNNARNQACNLSDSPPAKENNDNNARNQACNVSDSPPAKENNDNNVRNQACNVLDSPPEKENNDTNARNQACNVSDAPPAKENNDNNTKLKRRIIKNVVVVSVEFLLVLTAITVLMHLESSVNGKYGPWSLGAAYFVVMTSNFFISTWLINKCGDKWTLFIGTFGYALYTAAQLYPREWVLLTAGAAMGLGLATTWTAWCTYIDKVGRVYASITGESEDVVVSRLLGMSSACASGMSYIVGSVLMMTILTPNIEGTKLEAQREFCGVNYCPMNKSIGNNTISVAPKEDDFNFLTEMLLVLILCAMVLVVTLLDPVEKCGVNVDMDKKIPKSGFELLKGSLKLLANPKQLLLLPFAVWSGLLQAYMLTDYSEAFVECGLGVDKLGYIYLCFGVSTATTGLCLGYLVKLMGHTAVVYLASCTNVLCIAMIFVWSAYPHLSWMVYLVALLWGVPDAIGMAEIKALYGLTFPDQLEEAYSTVVMLEATGFVISFVLQPLVCNLCSTVVILVILFVAKLCFAKFVYDQKIEEKRNNTCKQP